jgi:hypothetical protein
VLHTELYGDDAALLPYVGAALQVLWTAGAARLGVSEIAALDVPGVCPCCGFLPVASVIRTVGEVGNLRYLHCALCNTEWNLVRLKCSACDVTEGVTYRALRNEAGKENDAIRAETCESLQELPEDRLRRKGRRRPGGRRPRHAGARHPGRRSRLFAQRAQPAAGAGRLTQESALTARRLGGRRSGTNSPLHCPVPFNPKEMPMRRLLSLLAFLCAATFSLPALADHLDGVVPLHKMTTLLWQPQRSSPIATSCCTSATT